MANDEMDQATNSPESSMGDVTVSDDAASVEQETQQSPKKRFSFYDAKAVGSIGLGSSGSLISQPKEEKPNPNRFRPSVIDEDENLANAQLNSKEQADRSERHDSVQNSDDEKILRAAKSDPKEKAIVNEETTQMPLDQRKKEDNGKSSADEILRSLQETEDQRMKILQPTTAPLSGSLGSVQSSRDSDERGRGGGHPMTGVDIAASTVAAVTSTSAHTSFNGSDVSNNNPYEDTIRTALNLLRKHRSSPKFSPRTSNAIDLEDSGGGFKDNDTTSNVKLDQHYILNQRSYDDGEDDDNDNERAVDNAVQEAKIKSKQRQERMAKYASRLQELKSSLPPEQKLTSQFSPSETQNHDNAEDDINARDDFSKTDPSLPQQTEPDIGEDISSKMRQQLPNQIHQDIKPSLTEDSTGLVSELSQYSNHYSQRPHHSNLLQKQDAIIEEQVQKGVEKILVAILEASKNRSAGDSTHGEGSHAQTHVQMDKISASSGDANDALLQVLHELLPSSRSIDTGSLNTRDSDGKAALLSSKNSASIMSNESSVNNRSRKSSVVDELLAEVDDEDHLPKSKPSPSTEPMLPSSYDNNATSSQYWAEGDEKKMTDDRRCSENQQSSETDTTSVILAKINQDKRDTSLSGSADIDIDRSKDDTTNDNSLFESDASGVDDLGSRPSYSDEEDDDMDTTYDDDDDSYDGNEEEEGHRGGVLGPLSREAGGTTGVVLDVESDGSSPSGSREKAYLPSVVNHTGTSNTGANEQRILNNREKNEILANYDVVGTTTNIRDEEATELMRTLCAHLLPFGVDRTSAREDSTPVWDDENENEPGYRIIRLTRGQLRRVECAFDAMVTRLKHNSHTSLNGLEGQFDENFIRELEEAERLLDDEEERNNREKTNMIAAVDERTKIQPSTSSEPTDDYESLDDIPHPEFPGVKSAGKGEMGDLEYFQLPIIFKSHVTGFEPTKDMTLEPGNIIAGQYLVESELGSAAFSTAYRCVDLSSEDDDGHEEVCLKVIKNTKDFFDQSLDEIKILELLRQTGKCDENYILRVKTFFYYREHLIIVTELLRQNLFEFGKFIVDNDEEPYFTLPRLAYITRQCLIALRFVHNLGLVHSDVKPENILLGSYSRAQIKLIDFGSSCYLTDRQSSYIQSRSYRAPEVVLGLPYDGRIDVWSLGCVVAEMYTGEVTFQNDSIVSMLSRIETFRGSFPRHMIAQGRQSGRFFTKSGLLYEVVGHSDEEEGLSVTPPAPDDEESASDAELDQVEFDIFQPKSTHLSTRLGFDADLMDDYGGKSVPAERKIEQMFTDFVAKLLTIDPDNRPSAEEALKHPYMIYAASLTDDEIKYPRS